MSAELDELELLRALNADLLAQVCVVGCREPHVRGEWHAAA